MTLLEKLLEKRNAERITVKEIGEVLDIPIEKINSWIRNNTEPKYSDGVKIVNWLNGQPIDIENNVLNDDGGGIKYGKSADKKDLSMQAIVNLTTTNQTLANNSSRLIALLEEKEKRITANVQEENLQVAPETFQVLLAAIGEVATGRRYGSVEEFEATLNKQIFGKIKGKKV